MADSDLPRPDAEAFDNFVRAQGLALHAKDLPPKTLGVWEERKKRLRAAMFQAMGTFPESPCPLDAKVLGELKRPGYRIEKLVYQTRPDVWVTANAYVPEPAGARAPAVLVVHGHWPWARIDPTVQARCLGLVKLGFFVLAVDAFGAGERYSMPARGTYHGALYGSTLWPTGHTLLGMQVYDNRRAVDYLRTRPEVDGDRLGITGASGGGNQSMYAGALDERIRAVVPVCSVGTYQAYLHVACCVCEVLPGALRFAEEGDVLALVAPRALLVVNATKDGIQFSVGEAEKSIVRARPVFKLYQADEKLRHAVFESGHDYSQPMRETMYGWMTQWLKGEGAGRPVAEPKLDIERPEDLRCYPDNVRPKGFLFPPAFAAREARALLQKYTNHKISHAEQWESTAVYLRDQLRTTIFGGLPKLPRPVARLGKSEISADSITTPVWLETEPKPVLPAVMKGKANARGKQAVCVLLHLDGNKAALQHPLSTALVKAGWLVVAPELRATGELRSPRNPLRGAPDHNSAEHALWLGRPLLGQWVFDVLCLLEWLAIQPGLDLRRTAVAGLGQAGVVALCCGGLFDEQIAVTMALESPATYVTEDAYGPGTFMGLLAPGILRLVDIPQLAALSAPRRMLFLDGVTPQGKRLTEQGLKEALTFTNDIFKLYRADRRLTIAEAGRLEDVVADL